MDFDPNTGLPWGTNPFKDTSPGRFDALFDQAHLDDRMFSANESAPAQDWLNPSTLLSQQFALPTASNTQPSSNVDHRELLWPNNSLVDLSVEQLSLPSLEPWTVANGLFNRADALDARQIQSEDSSTISDCQAVATELVDFTSEDLESLIKTISSQSNKLGARPPSCVTPPPQVLPPTIPEAPKKKAGHSKSTPTSSSLLCPETPTKSSIQKTTRKSKPRARSKSKAKTPISNGKVDKAIAKTDRSKELLSYPWIKEQLNIFSNGPVEQNLTNRIQHTTTTLSASSPQIDVGSTPFCDDWLADSPLSHLIQSQQPQFVNLNTTSSPINLADSLLKTPQSRAIHDSPSSMHPILASFDPYHNNSNGIGPVDQASFDLNQAESLAERLRHVLTSTSPIPAGASASIFGNQQNLVLPQQHNEDLSGAGHHSSSLLPAVSLRSEEQPNIGLGFCFNSGSSSDLPFSFSQQTQGASFGESNPVALSTPISLRSNHISPGSCETIDMNNNLLDLNSSQALEISQNFFQSYHLQPRSTSSGMFIDPSQQASGSIVEPKSMFENGLGPSFSSYALNTPASQVQASLSPQSSFPHNNNNNNNYTNSELSSSPTVDVSPQSGTRNNISSKPKQNNNNNLLSKKSTSINLSSNFSTPIKKPTRAVSMNVNSTTTTNNNNNNNQQEQEQEFKKILKKRNPSNSILNDSNNNNKTGSIFVNFTSKDSKKLLSGVAPSGSSKRKRQFESSNINNRNSIPNQNFKNLDLIEPKRRVVSTSN